MSESKFDFRKEYNLPSHIPDNAILSVINPHVQNLTVPPPEELYFTGCVYTKEGYYSYYLNGRLHNENGPANKFHNSSYGEDVEVYWLHGWYFELDEEGKKAYEEQVKHIQERRTCLLFRHT